MTNVMTKATMRTARCLLLAVAGSLFITACDTSAGMKDSSGSNNEAGWKSLEQAEVAKLFTGNSTAEESGRWVAFYAADGRKAIWVRNKGTVNRKWWVVEQSARNRDPYAALVNEAK